MADYALLIRPAAYDRSGVDASNLPKGVSFFRITSLIEVTIRLTATARRAAYIQNKKATTTPVTRISYVKS